MADLICDIGELLSAYLDGELRPGELEQVTEHLGDCEDCVLEFRYLKEARTSLRTLPRLEAPDWVVEDAVHLAPELSAYLDGELVTAELPMVIAHLQECVRCREELLGLDHARTAVRALPRVEPPEFLDVRRAAKAPRPHRWQVPTAMAGAAAAVILTLGLTSSSTPVRVVDADSFADRHIARASVETGFAVLPAVARVGAP